MPYDSIPSTLMGCVLVTTALAGSAAAQTAPEVEWLFPAGGQRGTRVEVLLGGKFMPGPCGLVVTGDGVAAENAVVSDRFALTLENNAGREPLEIRLFAPQGGSAPFPFLIGDLPEIIQTRADEVRELKLPVTVNGRFHPAGDLHRFALDLTAGQQVVCAASARAIRSPVDSTLRLLDAAGQVVATSVAHRTADALLVFRAPQAGRYTLQIYDFQFARGPQHIYRLTVTDGPWIDYAFPAGLPENVDGDVTLFGWNLPGANERTMSVRVPASAAGTRELTLSGGANRTTLVIGRTSESLEKEPNDAAAQAQPVTLPITVNGRLEKPGDIDVFSFMATKGDRLAIEVASASLGFAADPAISVTDETGKSLVELDDGPTSRDPSLRFTAPADGRYFVVLREHSRQGGDDFVYRLQIAPPRPDFTARVDVASFALQSGQTANLPVRVERLDGFDAELEVAAINLPNGVESKPQPVPKTPNAAVTLPFTAAAKLGPVSGLVRIVVRTVAPQALQQRDVLIAENPQAKSFSRSLWLAVSPEVPFTLKTTATILEAPRLAAFAFPVSAQRKEGFTGAIRLVGVEPDRRGTVVPLAGNIDSGSSEGTIPLVIQHGVTEGTTHRCRVMGVAEVLAADGTPCQVFHVAPGSMSMGCQPSQLTMTVEPAVVVGRPGQSVQVKVQLMRRVTMDQVVLRVESPREGKSVVSCEPVIVSADQGAATMTLKFAEDAAIPPRSAVTIQAESSRAGLPIYGQASFRLETP